MVLLTQGGSMKLGVILAIMLIATSAHAQCVGEVKDVIQDPIRGSIIVETQYVLNGQVVDTDATPCPTCIGRTRYLETSGTNQEIIDKTKADVAIHCENLIRRIPTNRTFLQTEKLKQQKALTQPVIDSIKGSLVGQKETKTQVTDKFKGKDIKVTYDEKNTVTNSLIGP